MYPVIVVAAGDFPSEHVVCLSLEGQYSILSFSLCVWTVWMCLEDSITQVHKGSKIAS